MNEKIIKPELADMGMQELTDEDLAAVAGGNNDACVWAYYRDVDGQRLMYCRARDEYYSLHKTPCDTCLVNAMG